MLNVPPGVFRRLIALAPLGPAFVCACLVDVDESKLHPADAGSDVGGDEAVAYVGMPCGIANCQPPGQVCCASVYGDPDIGHGACSTSALCQTGDFFRCIGPRDCQAAMLPSALCCAVHERGAWTKTMCAETCEATTSILCDPNGASCPGASRCLPSSEFPKLFGCRPP